MKLLQLFCLLLASHCALSTNYVITAPKAIRLGGNETVYLNLHGYQNGATVDAYLQDLPDKEHLVYSNVRGKYYDQAAAEQPISIHFLVQPRDFVEFHAVQRVALTVDVQAQAGGSFRKEIPILVVPQSGYLFVITNQPVYKPGDSVLIRAFVLNQTMERDPSKIHVTIKNPDGIGTTSKIKSMIDRNSFVEHKFDINNDPEFGLWSVEVSFALNGYDTKAETHFKVDRFVLPTFQVDIAMDQEYVTADQNAIEGTIKGRYSYGEPVTGSLYLAMKIKIIKDNGDQITKTFYQVPQEGLFTAPFNNGAERFQASVAAHLLPILEAADVTIEEVIANQGYIFVEATITETGSGHHESAISSNIPIVDSPFAIDTTRTELYFIQGFVYTFRMNILYVTKEPAEGVDYTIHVNNQQQAQGISDAKGAIDVQLNLDNALSTQNIFVQVGDQDRTITIARYQSANDRHLRITTALNKVYAVHENLQFTFNFDGVVSEIRFFVVARGTLVHSGVNYPVQGNVQSSQRFVVSQAMVPGARIVAYYLVGNSEIVSASFWFDVEKVCKHELRISFNADQIEPGDSLRISFAGAPNALVSVTAVDRAAYFLYNGSRLTRDTMFDKMESYDQGCSRNSGRDGPHVFEESGLLLTTPSITPELMYNLQCSSDLLSRKKRQVTVDEDTSAVSQTYIANRLEICSNSAVLESFLGDDFDSCDKRTERCRESQENLLAGDCCDIFYIRCKKEVRKRFINRILGIVGRSGANIAAAAGSVQTIRKDFDESLTFRNVQLDQAGTGQFGTSSSHSITTFEFDAVSMEPSAADGWCVAKTKNLKIFQNIFIQVYAAYAYKRREQASLRVAVFNYGDDALDMIIDVKPPPNDELCTHFPPMVWSELQRSTRVGSHASISTTIAILPLRVGDDDTTIQFRARLPNNTVVDIIERTLRIEKVGEVLDIHGSEPIDLRSQSRQTFEFQFRFPEQYVLESRKCWLYAYSNFMGPSIEADPLNSEPRDIATIFRKPHGCGEQNMIYTGPNVYAHMYLDASGNLHAGTAAHTASADRIEAGFLRELGFRSTVVNKKAWSVYSNYNPSTWLNAYVDKVFTKATSYVDLNTVPICNSLNWLLDQQHPNGEFVENAKVYHKEMHGGVGGSLTLTSYVVISLLETQSRCPSELNMRVQAAATNGINYLIANKNDATLRTPYGLALFGYALALHRPSSRVTNQVLNRLLRLRIIANGKTHWAGLGLNEIAGTDIHPYWYQTKPLAVNIEATAYALLALVEREKRVNNPPTQRILDITRGTVLWLIGQRNDGGAFVTTQDTVIGLQALATYQTWTDSIERTLPTNFDITITAPNTSWRDAPPRPQFHALTNENARYRHEVEVPQDVINHQNVTVTAEGMGEGVVSYRCIYRTQLEEEACHFNLSYTVQLLNKEEADNLIEPLAMKLTINVQAVTSASGMSIIEVGLMTGFKPDEPSILRLSMEKAADGVIQRYEITNVSVIFYLAKIPNNRVETLAFKMRQLVPVANPQPARIFVYDYYEPAVHCGMFYALDGFRPKILTSNCEENTDSEFCTCAEGRCAKCRTRNQQLTKTACIDKRNANCGVCEPGNDCLDLESSACTSNYVYEVNVTSVSEPMASSEFYTFQADILNVLKHGSVEAKDGKAKFLMRSDCLRKCNDDKLDAPDRNNDEYSNIIKTGRLLRIMGSPAESNPDKNGNQQVNFRLDSETVIERIIPEKKCSRNENKFDKLKCGTRRVKPKNVEKCEEAKKMIAACINQQDLLDLLREGCS